MVQVNEEFEVGESGSGARESDLYLSVAPAITTDFLLANLVIQSETRL